MSDGFLIGMGGDNVGSSEGDGVLVGWGADFVGSECLWTSRRGEKDRPAPLGRGEEKEDCR